jgi:P27 family predicted phage terminase small subunit
MSAMRAKSGPKKTPKIAPKLDNVIPLPGAKIDLKNPPPPPSWISKEAKIEWQEMAPIMAASGLLTHADLTTFAEYCQTWALFKIYSAQCAADPHKARVTVNGWVIDEGTGKKTQMTQTSPMTAMLNLQDKLSRLCSKLGFSPADRVGLKGLGEVMENEFGNLLD